VLLWCEDKGQAVLMRSKCGRSNVQRSSSRKCDCGKSLGGVLCCCERELIQRMMPVQKRRIRPPQRNGAIGDRCDEMEFQAASRGAPVVIDAVNSPAEVRGTLASTSLSATRPCVGTAGASCPAGLVWSPRFGADLAYRSLFFSRS